MIVHADDYGITSEQARAILALSSACGGKGALSSVSIFANSPAFDNAAELVAPFFESGKINVALHVNLVEGRPCSKPEDIPLLVNERGTFCHDFTGLLKLSVSKARAQTREQLQRECEAQIDHFLHAFPQAHAALRVDSHQHTHAIPLVFDALMDAVNARGCSLAHVRVPIENLQPYRASGHMKSVSPINMIKNAVLTRLGHHIEKNLPKGCETSSFCGVLMSGNMQNVDAALLHALEQEAQRHGKQIEVLFHPVSVPLAQCLDPQNAPFAQACASPERDGEARVVRSIGIS